MSRVLSSSLSHRGRKRANNEDFLASFEPTDQVEQEASGSLYVVADGVGGAELGERASQYAAEKVLYEYYLHAGVEVGERLRRIIEQVNHEIYLFADQSSQVTRMGTTLVAAAIRRDLLTVANVGDSRAYLIRAGEVTQITRDHNLAGELIHNGSLTEAEALTSKAKNRLTRALGSEDEIHVDIFSSIQLQPGDKVLLCTDGLTRYALREDIGSLTQEGTPDAIVKGLVHFANQHGGADNVSVSIMAFEPKGSEQVPDRVQKTPKRVDWDTMQTQPWVPTRRRRVLPAPVFWVLMGLSAVVVIGGLTLGLPKLASPVPLKTLSLNPSTVSSFTAEFIQATTTITLTPTFLPTETLTSAPTTTKNNTQPSIPPQPDQGFTCVVIVDSNSNHGMIYYLDKFMIRYDKSKDYYSCGLYASTTEGSGCSSKMLIPRATDSERSPILNQNMAIIISEINSAENCQSGGGFWVQVR